MNAREAVPGRRLIRLLSPLVPSDQRASWRAEWEAELAYGQARRRARGQSRLTAALVMRLRCAGAFMDALLLRAHASGGWMAVHDSRMAVRSLFRRPGLSIAVIVVLGLGIGGATAVFSVLDPMLFRPLPYPFSDRLAELWGVMPGGQVVYGMEAAQLTAVAEALPESVFERVELTSDRNVVVTGAGEPEIARMSAMTPGALTLLGARALRGRLFTEEDARPGAPNVVVIGEGLWRGRWGEDASIVGKTVLLSDVPYTVIGVMPRTFKYPLGTVSLWTPLRLTGPGAVQHGLAVVRLREGVSVDVAQVHLDAISKRLMSAQPRDEGWGAAVQPFEHHRLRGGLATGLRLLGGAVLCLVLIACVNAATLLLARSNSRRSEVSVRTALGATRGQLVRQLLTESVLLSLLAGLLGVMVAYAGVRAMTGILPESLTRFTLATIGIDGRVLAFTFAASVLTGLLFGTLPSLRASRLTGSGRTHTESAAVKRAAGSMVVLQVALSMVLLTGAGLLARSFSRLLAVDPGFEPRGLVVLTMSLSAHRYPEPANIAAFYERVAERLRDLPNVTGVAVAEGSPPKPGLIMFPGALETEDGVVHSLGTQAIPAMTAGRDYFDVLRIPIVDGGTHPQTRGDPNNVIIDVDLAALLWPGERAVGRRFRRTDHENADWWTVVGVAGDVKLMGPDDRGYPFEIYFAPSEDLQPRYRSFIARTAGDAALLIPHARSVVRELDPDQPIQEVATAETAFRETLERPRFMLLLAAIFAGFALVLAVLGIYSVMAHTVARGTREIGVRIALGATGRAVLQSVLLRGLVLAALGAALGAIGAIALSRVIRSQLFGIQPTDPATLVGVAAVLLSAACAAVLIPALRATRIRPTEALRME